MWNPSPIEPARRKREWQTAPVSKTGLAINYSGPKTFLKILPPGWQKSQPCHILGYGTIVNIVGGNILLQTRIDAGQGIPAGQGISQWDE
jgi:hypothetical protein